MSKRFLTPIRVLNSASDPATGNEGDIYYNTSIDKLKIYSNSTWVEIGSSGSSTYVQTDVQLSNSWWLGV